MKVYEPRACPMSATPAAEPTDSIEPPTPAVSVTSNHWYRPSGPDPMSGFMPSTANITGTLSRIAEMTPTPTLATVGPSSPYR